eukprot:262172_1
MDILRSLIGLQIKDTKQAHNKSFKQQNQSADQLHPTKHQIQAKNPFKNIAYSSINLKKNHIQCTDKTMKELNINNTDNNNENDIISVTIASAASSIMDLALPFEYELQSENDITLHKIPLYTVPSSDYFTSSIGSMSTSNTPLNIYTPIKYSNQTTIENKHNENEYKNKNVIGVDIELETFPTNIFKYMYHIGEGAFGIVNKSFHLTSCEIVAIKQCRSYENIAIKQFKKEIAICNEFVQCPYIIDMIEYGMNKTNNNVCIALEYMNMGSLNKNISILQCNNHLERIKHISFCILNALDCLHCKLYVHNDIKPANILFNDNGDVKLSDFGCIEQMKNM